MDSPQGCGDDKKRIFAEKTAKFACQLALA